jgi:hypothetical protein
MRKPIFPNTGIPNASCMRRVQNPFSRIPQHQGALPEKDHGGAGAEKPPYRISFSGYWTVRPLRTAHPAIILTSDRKLANKRKSVSVRASSVEPIPYP